MACTEFPILDTCAAGSRGSSLVTRCTRRVMRPSSHVFPEKFCLPMSLRRSAPRCRGLEGWCGRRGRPRPCSAAPTLTCTSSRLRKILPSLACLCAFLPTLPLKASQERRSPRTRCSLRERLHTRITTALYTEPSWRESGRPDEEWTFCAMPRRQVPTQRLCERPF
jgi:hypothetical protein